MSDGHIITFSLQACLIGDTATPFGGRCPPHSTVRGAGTPLGDPIEVGALTAVLTAGQGSSKAASLILAASKSWVGHSEPAAGAVGMAHLCLAFTQQAALPIMHLRNLNPHLLPMLQPGRAGARGAHIPRQTGGLIGRALQAGAFHAGLSAFAFQGTNAHVIMAAPHASDSTDSQDRFGCKTDMHFQRQRHWVAPAPHALLIAAAAANSVITFHSDLSSPASAFLLDHVVSEQCLLPATAFLELAFSSAKLDLSAPAANLALLDTTLAAPLLLPLPHAGRRSTSGTVIVQLAMHKASLSVSSHSAAKAQHHAFASVAALAPLQHAHAATDASHLLTDVFGWRRSRTASHEAAESPSAVGGLAQPDNSADAFNMHPAATDNALHLAMSFDTSVSSTQLRVPSNLQAMHMAGANTATQSMWAFATPSLDASTSSRTHTFGLITHGGHSHAALQGLTVKPLANSLQTLTQSTDTAAVQDCLYELTWPADMMQSRSSSVSTAVVASKRGRCSVENTAAAIHFLQRAAQQPEQQPIVSALAASAVTAAGRPSEMTVGAAAQASLLRAAAQELPGWHISCKTLDLLTPASRGCTGVAVASSLAF